MEKHLPWYKRQPGNATKTYKRYCQNQIAILTLYIVHQIWTDQAKKDFNKLTAAQMVPYINASNAANGLQWLTEDSLLPPPGVMPHGRRRYSNARRRGRRQLSADPSVGPVLPSYVLLSTTNVLPFTTNMQPSTTNTQPPVPDYSVTYKGYAPAILLRDSSTDAPILLKTQGFDSMDCRDRVTPEYGHWKKLKRLGRGGYGTAFLWVKLENGIVQERLVAKDANIEEMWDTPQTWLFGEIGQIPQEVAMHHRVGGPPQNQPGRSTLSSTADGRYTKVFAGIGLPRSMLNTEPCIRLWRSIVPTNTIPENTQRRNHSSRTHNHNGMKRLECP